MTIPRTRSRALSGSLGHQLFSGGSPAITADEFDLFEGSDKVNVTLCVAPALMRFAAEESRKEADVSKASRNAREEKLMAATGLKVDDVIAAALGRNDHGEPQGEVEGGKGRRRRR